MGLEPIVTVQRGIMEKLHEWHSNTAANYATTECSAENLTLTNQSGTTRQDNNLKQQASTCSISHEINGSQPSVLYSTCLQSVALA
jgi:hypothetical protein